MHVPPYTSLNSSPPAPQLHAHSESQSVAFFGNRVIADIISKIKMKSHWIWVPYWILVDPKSSMPGAFIRTEDTEMYRHTGRGLSEGGGRDRSDAAVSQGLPRLVRSRQKLREARKGPPIEPSEGTWFCQHLNVRLVASSRAGECIPVAVSPPYSGLLCYCRPWKPYALRAASWSDRAISSLLSSR